MATFHLAAVGGFEALAALWLPDQCAEAPLRLAGLAYLGGTS